MLRLCDGKVTFFQRKKVTFFYVSAILCIEAGECFPVFKQQNMLGSPSGELPEGLVQANLVLASLGYCPYIACLKRISALSFIPPVPYPPLRGTFP